MIQFGENYDDVNIGAVRILGDTLVSHDYVFHTMLGLFAINPEVYQAEKDISNQARGSHQIAKNEQ